MTDEKALNEKLAKWRFDADNIYVHGEYIYRRTTYVPDDDDWNIEEVDDFTHSLDACFKWLVPEYDRRFGPTKTRQLLRGWVDSAYLALPKPDKLCLAIEKLIDAEGQYDNPKEG